jgi:hypothetical protein
MAWELAGTLPATGACCYDFPVHTHCNTSGGDTCWTYFYVSAHTGTPGQRFDSAVERGYSVDDLHAASPASGDPEPGILPAEDGPRYIARFGLPQPNPSRDWIEIAFELARPCRAEVGIYDVSGRRVATVLAGPLSPGIHTAAWDGSITGSPGAPPGVYFVSLAAGPETRTAKVVLAR